MLYIILPERKSGGIYQYNKIIEKSIKGINFKTIYLSKNNVSEIIEIPKGSVVLLHLSIYGFSKRGVPLWLLCIFLRKYTEFQKFIIFFHELYGFGPPWTSSFWLSPIQKYIVLGILKISSEWITTCQTYKLKLESHKSSKIGHLLPVFSTVGERLDKHDKEKIIVVFGLPSSRLKVYQNFGEKFFIDAVKAGFKIIDIGVDINNKYIYEVLSRIGVNFVGYARNEDISKILTNAKFGLMHYWTELLPKSTIFAAYVSHGVMPIVSPVNNKEFTDELIPGIDYVLLKNFDFNENYENKNIISRYRNCNISNTIIKLSSILKN